MTDIENLKQMTGSGQYFSRILNNNDKSFVCIFPLIMSGSQVPRYNDADSAFQKRIRHFSFNPKERIPSLE